jgi:hypothetical protein
MIRKSGNRFSGKIMLKQKDNGAYFPLLNGAAANRRQPFNSWSRLIAAERFLPSFRDGPQDQTPDVQLRIGESRDSGFALPRAPE